MIETPERSILRRICCSVWTHPLARLLLGERMHPGGEETTAATVQALALEPGSVVLDVGCGAGFGLHSLADAGFAAVGLDLTPDAAKAASGAAPTVAGAAEALPLEEACFDGAIAECVLSLIPDKSAALGELHRVVRRSGRVALSDVTLDGTLPLPLDPLTSWSACVGGALETSGYVRLLRESGFGEVRTESLDCALTELLEQVRRRLVLAEMAVRAGRIDLKEMHPGLGPEMFARSRDVISLGIEAVRQAILGYKLFTATRI